MQFKHVGPVWELEIPVLGVTVTRGEEFTVPDDLVEYFDAQPELWERVTDEPVQAETKGAGK